MAARLPAGSIGSAGDQDRHGRATSAPAAGRSYTAPVEGVRGSASLWSRPPVSQAAAGGILGRLMRVRFGINFMPTAAPAEVVGWAKEVERLGYELLGISDSQSICRDVYMILAQCATNTERIRFGPRVITPVTRHT